MAQVTTSNMEIAKHAYDLFAKGDVETITRDVLSPDIEWIEPEALPEGGTHKGPQEVLKNVFGALAETWGEDMEVVPENWISEREQVVAEGRFKGTAPKTGKDYDIPFCHVMRFKDGKLVHFQNYTDTAASLAALEK